jgi:hypothetical protein
VANLLTALKKKATDRVSAATGKLSPDMLTEALSSALAQYSQARPVEVVAKVAGSGGFDYPLTGIGAILASWVRDFSQILGAIYPYDATVQTQSELESETYGVVRLDTGDVLRFFEASPTAAQWLLFRYTSRHTVTDDVVAPPSTGASTIPDGELDAVADLIAAYCCDELASFYSQSTDSSVNADVVAHLSKAQEYRSQAAQFRKSYAAKLKGDDADSLKPAGGFVHTDSRFSNTIGDRYLFHARR